MADQTDAKQAARRRARECLRAHRDEPRPSFLHAVEALAAWETAQTVGLYIPFGVEPPTEDILAVCHASGRRVALPCWKPDATRREGGTYVWAHHPPGGTLRPGLFGIPEPQGETIDTAQIDLFLLPGLSFDRRGVRLGHGRGFIDRLLDGRRCGSQAAVVAALVFPWQLTDDPLPAEPHDVPMDILVLPTAP